MIVIMMMQVTLLVALRVRHLGGAVLCLRLMADLLILQFMEKVGVMIGCAA